MKKNNNKILFDWIESPAVNRFHLFLDVCQKVIVLQLAEIDFGPLPNTNQLEN